MLLYVGPGQPEASDSTHHFFGRLSPRFSTSISLVSTGAEGEQADARVLHGGWGYSSFQGSFSMGAEAKAAVIAATTGTSLLSQCSASLSWVLSLHMKGNIRDLGLLGRKD